MSYYSNLFEGMSTAEEDLMEGVSVIHHNRRKVKTQKLSKLIKKAGSWKKLLNLALRNKRQESTLEFLIKDSPDDIMDMSDFLDYVNSEIIDGRKLGLIYGLISGLKINGPEIWNNINIAGLLEVSSSTDKEMLLDNILSRIMDVKIY